MRRRRSSRWMAVLSVMLLLVLTAVPVAAQDEGEFPLTILHTNDVHAHIEQFDSSGGECSEDAAAAGECFGGVSRRATKINEVMSSGDNVILVDAGDEFQGSLFFTQYKGAATAELMDMLGYQAMAVGNHEFDDGPATLGEFIDSVPFPVLSANIVASAEPALDGKILASRSS